MRGIPLPMLVILAGCAAPEMNAPSLAPRAAEAIDPRVPVPEAPVPTQATPALVRQLEGLVAEAIAGDQAFRASADDAERLAEAAGPPQSESWIAAQQALSAAVAARAPVTRALGEIDALGAGRIQQLGGIGAADLAAINAAAARVAEIDARHAALIERLQARLRG
jgi:hypothetical protein